MGCHCLLRYLYADLRNEKLPLYHSLTCVGIIPSPSSTIESAFCDTVAFSFLPLPVSLPLCPQGDRLHLVLLEANWSNLLLLAALQLYHIMLHGARAGFCLYCSCFPSSKLHHFLTYHSHLTVLFFLQSNP